MAEIEKRANPPNGQILNQNVIPTLERDLRALLAEVRRLRSAEKDRYERDYSTYRMF